MKRPDYTGATPEKLAKVLFKPLKRGGNKPKIQKRQEVSRDDKKRSQKSSD